MMIRVLRILLWVAVAALYFWYVGAIAYSAQRGVISPGVEIATCAFGATMTPLAYLIYKCSSFH